MLPNPGQSFSLSLFGPTSITSVDSGKPSLFNISCLSAPVGGHCFQGMGVDTLLTILETVNLGMPFTDRVAYHVRKNEGQQEPVPEISKYGFFPLAFRDWQQAYWWWTEWNHLNLTSASGESIEKIFIAVKNSFTPRLYATKRQINWFCNIVNLTNGQKKIAIVHTNRLSNNPKPFVKS